MSQFKQYLRESIDHALNEESPSGWDTTPLDLLLHYQPYEGHEEAKHEESPFPWTLPTESEAEQFKQNAINHSYKQAEAYYGSEVWNNLTAKEQDNLARHFRENPARQLY